MFEPVLHRLIASGLQLGRERRFRRFEALCADPRRAQAAMLQDLMTTHGRTALARRLQVPSHPGHDLRAFRDRVPLTSYDDVAPEIDAAFHGAPDQLAPGHPVFFAMTSGTSGRRKLIPITEDYRQSFQRPMHLFLWSLQNTHPALFDRRVLYIVGPAVCEHSPTGVPVGYISGYNYQKMPASLRRFYAVPYEIFALADPDVNAYGIARAALMHDLSFAIGITTFPFAVLAKTLEIHRERLLRDIHDGTFTPPGIAAPTRALAVASWFRPDPNRARELRRRADKAGAFAPWALWPHLDVLSCWYHGAAGSARAAMERGWRPKALRSALYSATEGWFNVPLRDGDPSGVAALDSVFFEFEILGSDGEGTGETLLLDEVEVGGRYGLVITTRVGLWRYRIMDEVRVTGFFGRVPEFHFVQKAGAVLSAHHDMTTAAHFEQAFAETFREIETFANARWVVWPEPNGSDGCARYGVVIGLAGSGVERSEIEAAQRCFDAALQRANAMYQADRDDGVIGMPAFNVISLDDMDAWDAQRLRLSGAGHQGKVAQLVKTAEEIPPAFRCNGFGGRR